jgi:hypothetical protein
MNQNRATKVKKRACVSLYITIRSGARDSSIPTTATTQVGREAGHNTSRSRLLEGGGRIKTTNLLNI